MWKARRSADRAPIPGSFFNSSISRSKDAILPLAINSYSRNTGHEAEGDQ
jgi:hypothetical protein